MSEEQTQKPISKNEYERAFSELATFLLTQYKKKKQADLTNEPNKVTGQIENNAACLRRAKRTKAISYRNRKMYKEQPIF